jgi:hypothetical protein
MKIIFAALACCILLSFTACTHITTVPEGRAYVQYVAASTLRRHLEIIASDSLEGREMATAGERKASAYISKTFKSIDLKPAGTNGYLQTFEVVRDSIDEAFLWVGDKKFSLKKYGVTPTTYNDNADFAADTVIFAGYGIDTVQYSDYKNIDVRGKVILICEREPKTDSNHFLITGTSTKSPWSRGREGDEKKLACAKAHGARAVITYDPSFDTLSERYAILSTGGYHPPDSVEQLHNNIYFSIGNTLMKQLVGEAKAKELSDAWHRRDLLGSSFVINKPIKYHFKKQSWYEKASNVVGYIEGTDKKNEYVIVSAHYDHLGKEGNIIYHGADDNGSGTSSVMTIAEAFSKAAASGMRPRRSIIFLSVTGEEKGLFGSKYYVGHPLFPLAQTVADVNTDMIGRIDSAHEHDQNYVYVIGDGRLSTQLHEINERNNADFTHLTLDFRFDSLNDPNKFYYRSDHYEFAQKGIPITFYFDGIHQDYHRPSDTSDKINFGIMETRARLAFLTAWEIANREERLKVDKPVE